MSDVSSSPSSSTTEPGIQTRSQGPKHHGDQEKGEHVDQSGTEGRLDIDRDVVDPASSTSINNSEDVLIQNDVQDQSALAALQNGVSPSVSNLSVVPPAAGIASPVDTAAKSAQPLSAPQITEPLSAATDQAMTPSIAIPKVRLPHDRVGILEDRIKEDPKGDLEAWQNLIGEHRKRGKIEDARKVYERFLAVFPSAVSTGLVFIEIGSNHILKAEQWVAYSQMENESQNRIELEKIFQHSLLQTPYIQLWSLYLDHVRRHNNTTTDTSGKARQTIHQAYELALQNVGVDRDSGKLWQDYIQFIKSGPGNIGGSNWQDQQKMDLLRKTYQRAICVPTQSTTILWKEYDGFEMGLNKTTVFDSRAL